MKKSLSSTFTLNLTALSSSNGSNGSMGARALRTAAVAASLFVLPVFAVATESAAAERASELLRTTGRVPVQAAGPYVEVGTYRIQVSVKLGRANTVLPDGTWLYNDYSPASGSAQGTLVVRFANGRVSELYLASPATVAALQNMQRPAAATTLVASQDRR